MSTNSPSSNSAAMMARESAQARRGHNKPRCIKCSSVARSRCPFQSCKKCCAEAQNPCHIHVLKPNATFPDKSPTSGSTPLEQQSIEASPSVTTHRAASLLSTSFAQFNNLQTPMSSRRPLTEKEAAVVNEWRFKKLKEYKEGIIDMENEAFDRYMQNVSLLEEVLAVNNTQTEGSIDELSVEDSNKMMLSSLKLKERSNAARSERLKRKVQKIVDEGLRKLRRIDLNPRENELNKQNVFTMKDERVKILSTEKESSINDLWDRLSNARNEEDLKFCLELKTNIFGRHRAESMQIEGAELSNSEISENDAHSNSEYSPPKWFSARPVNQDVIVHIDSQFSSLERIQL